MVVAKKPAENEWKTQPWGPLRTDDSMMKAKGQLIGTEQILEKKKTKQKHTKKYKKNNVKRTKFIKLYTQEYTLYTFH